MQDTAISLQLLMYTAMLTTQQRKTKWTTSQAVSQNFSKMKVTIEIQVFNKNIPAIAGVF